MDSSTQTSPIATARWASLLLWGLLACDEPQTSVVAKPPAKTPVPTAAKTTAVLEGAAKIPGWAPPIGCSLGDHTPCAWLRELEKNIGKFPSYLAALEKLGWNEELCSTDTDVVSPECYLNQIPCWEQLVTSELGRPEMKPGAVSSRSVARASDDIRSRRAAKDKPEDVHHGFVDITPAVKVASVAEQLGATGLLIRPCRDGTKCEEPERTTPASAPGLITAKCGQGATECTDSIFHRLSDGTWQAMDTTENVMGGDEEPYSIGGHGPCTGFLVHPQYVLTTRHCACGRTLADQICGKPFDDLQFVLGYTDRQGKDPVSFTSANVIAVESVVGRPQSSDDRIDWAVLRLEKPLPSSTPVIPLAAPAEGLTNECTPLYAMGHPRGRPAAFAGARPGEGIPWAWLISPDDPLMLVNLDLTLGNSGSPVFALAEGATKGELVGIVVRAWSRTLDLINLEGLCPTEGCLYLGYGNYVLPVTKFAAEANEAICHAECAQNTNYCEDHDAEYRGCCMPDCGSM